MTAGSILGINSRNIIKKIPKFPKNFRISKFIAAFIMRTGAFTDDNIISDRENGKFMHIFGKFKLKLNLNAINNFV
jgi:hypothetical protein